MAEINVEIKAISQLNEHTDAQETDLMAVEAGSSEGFVGLIKKLSLKSLATYLLKDTRFITPEVLGTVQHRVGGSNIFTGICVSLADAGVGAYRLALSKPIKPGNVQLMAMAGWNGFISCTFYEGADPEVAISNIYIMAANDDSKDDLPFKLTILRIG